MLRVGEKGHAAVMAVCCLLVSAPLSAQQVIVQTLDRVAVNSIDSVLEMNFPDPMRDADFVDTGISGARFRACRLTAINGVFCLDGEVVKNWRDPDEPSQFTTVLDCRDPRLNLDSRKPDICSGMTVDSTGGVWIAGRNKGNSYSLIKAVRKPAGGSCPAGFDSLSLSDYCADEVASGRPLLIDINSVDGDVAKLFTHGAGILGLEERKTAVFFPLTGSPLTIASGKQGWGLQGSEELQSIGLLQVPDPTTGVRNLVLATTSNGRVLAVNADQGGTAIPVFNIPANREVTSAQCAFDAASYGIRASDKSGLVYVTDRQYCEVVALEARFDGAGHFTHLANATEPVFDAGGEPTGDERNLTLSTAAGPAATHPPEGPSVAPGISIDLLDCADECTLVTGGDGNPAATLSDVTLASQASGLTLFQIKNIPDCRYIPDVCEDLLGVNDLVAAGVVVDPAATGDPAAQLLNLTSLLPSEITDLFVDEPLPDMLMSRQYRGQQQNGFTFEAFFGVPEEGVVFRNTFVGEFDVFALAGSELGCELNLPPNSPLYTTGNQTGTLNWDVITTVSETFVTFTQPDRHVDTIINFDCGSSRSLTGRWSLKPYNLEITPCTRNDDPGDVWASDGICPVGGPETADDAVFAKLLLKLYDELGDALNQVACTDVDGGGSAPITASSCSTLNSQWLNGKDKLDKCWNATQQPKQSSGDQNCQSFLSQFSGFSSTLAGISGGGADPANRRGELRARVETIFHVYHERFVPSIPAAGFQEP